MQILIKFKSKLYDNASAFIEISEKLLAFLKETNSIILEINKNDAKQFKVKCNILPNHYRELMTDYQDSNLYLI